MFERGSFDYNEAGSLENLDRDKTYPINIGAKGCRGIDYLGMRPYFNKHLNRFTGSTSLEGDPIGKQEALKEPGYMGARPEIMWAFNEA